MMYFKSTTLSVIAKIFSSPPIVAGAFLIYKYPEASLFWGIFTLTFGIIIFGFRYEMFIYKTHIKMRSGFYKFVIWSSVIDIKEFNSIYLGTISGMSMTATASGKTHLYILFDYKYPEKYLHGNDSVAGVDLNAFGFNRDYDRKNYEFLSENIMPEISKLTGLPIMISEEVKEDFGVSNEE